MARIHIELPDSFLFTTEITVRASDLNYGGHVGNDSVLTLLQEVRILFYRQMGFKSELNLEGSVGQVISDAAVVYKAESFLGDVWVVKIAASDFTKYGFDLLYVAHNKATGKEVARAKTGMVCLDYETRKMASVPLPLLQQLTSGK